MTRARNSANLASHGNLFVDIANDRTGIGSVVPAQNLHVAGTAGFHADTTFTGDLYNTTWDRSANSLKFSDNAELRLGDGSDVRLYFDGGHTRFLNNTGQLDIRNNSLHLQSVSGGIQNYAKFLYASGVELYYVGSSTSSKKFETTAYGTNTTGTAVNDGLVVAGVATVTTMNVTGVLTYDDVTSVDSVGIVTARQGVHIDDSITHIGDTDTKIRFPQANAINLETGGTSRLSIDTSGNVTISGNLTVTGTTTQNNTVATTTKVFTLASGSANNAAADGAGILIDAGSDTDKTLKWLDSTDRWTFTGGDVSANAFHGDGSNLTGLNVAITAINNASNNRVVTSNGGTTVNSESSLTYNGSSLKIGDTSFSNVNSGAENLVIGTESSGSNRGLSIITHSANTGHLFFGDQDNGTMGGFRYQNGVDVLQGYSGGSAPFYLKSNALGLHENYPEAHSITIRGASQNDIPLLVIRKHTDGDTNHDEEIGRIKFKSNDNNIDSGNSVSRVELRAVHVNAAGAAKLEFYTVPNFTTSPVKTMTLNQEGRLCIGTDDAVAKLNVVHSSSDTSATGSGTLASCISVSNTNTSANNFAGIVFGDRTDSQDFIGGIFTLITDHTQNYGHLVFYTNGGGGRLSLIHI